MSVWLAPEAEQDLSCELAIKGPFPTCLVGDLGMHCIE